MKPSIPPLLLLAAARARPGSVPPHPRPPGPTPVPAKVETLYQKGLAYLAKTQTNNGSWGNLDRSNVGITALATVAFLAKGEDPDHGSHAKNIKNAITFLLKNQKQTNGYIGSSMYNHGFATLALAESLGMVDDDRIEPALHKAVQLHPQRPETQPPPRLALLPPTTPPPDTSVSGCQIVALLAARNAGIPVPDSAIKNGLDFMESCRSANGSYAYMPVHGGKSSGGRPTLTAIGSLCYSLAKQKKASGYTQSLAFLKKSLNYRDPTYPFYFEYYMSQALFHADEEIWRVWNGQNIRFLAACQMPDGSWAGKPRPRLLHLRRPPLPRPQLPLSPHL